MNEARKHVEHFMYYMYNNWCEAESKEVYGEVMGKHLWNKWCNAHDELQWFCYLDEENREKLIARIEEEYKNK